MGWKGVFGNHDASLLFLLRMSQGLVGGPASFENRCCARCRREIHRVSFRTTTIGRSVCPQECTHFPPGRAAELQRSRHDGRGRLNQWPKTKGSSSSKNKAATLPFVGGGGCSATSSSALCR